MLAIGEDFRRGLRAALYVRLGKPGLGTAIAIAAGLIVLNGILQFGFGELARRLFLPGTGTDMRALIKAYMIGILPAGILTFAIAYGLARIGGGVPTVALALRWPRLGLVGWIVILAGFLVAVYASVALLVWVFGIDVAQYTPGPNGESPLGGSAGLVKEALFDLANEPLFWVAWPSIIVGSPLAEEAIFRGQLFAALSHSRFGFAGATLTTSAVWALLHATEPWLMMLMIFIMGLILSVLLIRFGSLLVTIACHALWNGLFSLMVLGAQHT